MSNKSVLKAGHKKAEALVRGHMIQIGVRFAKEAVLGAIKAWDDDPSSDDLTGNVRTAFAAGVYYNGVMVGYPISIYNGVNGIKKPTHPYTKPGESGFQDYSTGYFIGSDADPAVQNYANPDLRFQRSESGRYGLEDTVEYLNKRKPNEKGLVVIVANMASYAPYLKLYRGLDILETESDNEPIRSKMMTAVGSVKEI